MSDDDLACVVFSVWVLVAFIALGAWREHKGDWNFPVPLVIAWPLVPIFGTVVGVGWVLVQIGRAPVRAWRNRGLPKARTVRR